MAEPAYPSLEKEAAPIGFEGVAAGEKDGQFSVEFTPSGGDGEKLTGDQQPSYRTFEGEPPTQASNEEISLLERKSSPNEEEKVRMCMPRPYPPQGHLYMCTCMYDMHASGRTCMHQRLQCT